MIKTIERFMERLFAKTDIIACIVISAMGITVIMNVLLRAFLDMPILGAYEIITYSIMIVISLTISSCALYDGHIAVSFIVDALPPRIRNIIEAITGVISLVIFYYVGKALILYAVKTHSVGELSSVLKIPYSLLVSIIFFGFILFVIVNIWKLIKSVVNVFEKKVE